MKWTLSMMFLELRVFLSLVLLVKVWHALNMINDVLKYMIATKMSAVARVPVEIDILQFHFSGLVLISGVRVLVPETNTEWHIPSIVHVDNIRVQFPFWLTGFFYIVTLTEVAIVEEVEVSGIRVNVEGRLTAADVMEYNISLLGPPPDTGANMTANSNNPTTTDSTAVVTDTTMSGTSTSAGMTSGTDADVSRLPNPHISTLVSNDDNNDATASLTGVHNCNVQNTHSSVATAPSYSSSSFVTAAVGSLLVVATATAERTPSISTGSTGSVAGKNKSASVDNSPVHSPQVIERKSYLNFMSLMTRAQGVLQQVDEQRSVLKERVSTAQLHLRGAVSVIRSEAQVFKQEVAQEGLLGATRKTLRQAYSTAKQHIEERVHETINDKIAALHKKLSGPTPNKHEQYRFGLGRIVCGRFRLRNISIVMRRALPIQFRHLEKKPLQVEDITLYNIGYNRRRVSKEANDVSTILRSASSINISPTADVSPSSAVQAMTIDKIPVVLPSNAADEETSTTILPNHTTPPPHQHPVSIFSMETGHGIAAISHAKDLAAKPLAAERADDERDWLSLFRQYTEHHVYCLNVYTGLHEWLPSRSPACKESKREVVQVPSSLNNHGLDCAAVPNTSSVSEVADTQKDSVTAAMHSHSGNMQRNKHKQQHQRPQLEVVDTDANAMLGLPVPLLIHKLERRMLEELYHSNAGTVLYDAFQVHKWNPAAYLQLKKTPQQQMQSSSYTTSSASATVDSVENDAEGSTASSFAGPTGGRSISTDGVTTAAYMENYDRDYLTEDASDVSITSINPVFSLGGLGRGTLGDY